MRIAIVGHRRLNNPLAVRADILQFLTNWLQDNPDEDLYVISGMAWGTDLIAAEVSLALKADNPKVHLIAAIPYENQDFLWSKDWRQLYHRVLSQADKKVLLCEGGHANWKFDFRNRWMVDNCDLVRAYIKDEKSGTQNCVNYATRKGTPISYGSLG